MCARSQGRRTGFRSAPARLKMAIETRTRRGFYASSIVSSNLYSIRSVGSDSVPIEVYDGRRDRAVSGCPLSILMQV